VKSRKHRGFSAKSLGPAGFDRLDPGRLDIDLLDLDPTAAGGGRVKQRRRFDHGRWIWIQRLWARACARPAASGGGRRRVAVAGGGEARDRVWGLDFVRSLHREMARATGRLARAARPAGATTTAHGTVGRRRKSGDGSKVLRSTSLTKSGTGVILTLLRNSGAAPRRRSNSDGEAWRRRRSRVPAARFGARGGV
jgi:hypothetical protein